VKPNKKTIVGLIVFNPLPPPPSFSCADLRSVHLKDDVTVILLLVVSFMHA
jgi:hypothetical protein